MAEGVPTSAALPARNGVTGLSPGWSLPADRLAVLAKVAELAREKLAPRAILVQAKIASGPVPPTERTLP